MATFRNLVKKFLKFVYTLWGKIMKGYLKYVGCQFLLGASVIIGITTISLMLFGAMGLWHGFLLLSVTGIVSWLTGQVVVARYQDIKRKKEKKIAEYVLHNPKIYGSIIGGWR